MIFFFTGTGNSLYAAKSLDEDIRSIPQVLHSDNLAFEAERIGIVCPVYGHEMPQMVKEFLRRATFHTPYLFAVLTYGNRRANAVELAEKAFESAGKKPDYIATLLMVDNFLPVFDMNEQTKIDKGVENQLAAIRADIGSRKREKQSVSAVDRLTHAGYLKRVSSRPETLWAQFDYTDNCVGCGICAKVCPAGCIRIENQRARRSEDGCQACYACVHACPKAAIRVKEILGFREKNPAARYRNEHVSLCELVKANNQTEE